MKPFKKNLSKAKKMIFFRKKSKTTEKKAVKKTATKTKKSDKKVAAKQKKVEKKAIAKPVKKAVKKQPTKPKTEKTSAKRPVAISSTKILTAEGWKRRCQQK